MSFKSLIAAAAIATSVAGISASQANAGSNIDFGFGVQIGGPGFIVGGGTPGYHGGYGGHGGHGFVDYGISCGEGRWVVKSAGYYKVKTVECSGSTYTYTGRMSGDKYRIKVKRSNGAIVSVSML
jgi:hypothetical protein